MEHMFLEPQIANALLFPYSLSKDGRKWYIHWRDDSDNFSFFWLRNWNFINKIEKVTEGWEIPRCTIYNRILKSLMMSEKKKKKKPKTFMIRYPPSCPSFDSYPKFINWFLNFFERSSVPFKPVWPDNSLEHIFHTILDFLLEKLPEVGSKQSLMSMGSIQYRFSSQRTLFDTLMILVKRGSNYIVALQRPNYFFLLQNHNLWS